LAQKIINLVKNLVIL